MNGIQSLTHWVDLFSLVCPVIMTKQPNQGEEVFFFMISWHSVWPLTSTSPPGYSVAASASTLPGPKNKHLAKLEPEARGNLECWKGCWRCRKCWGDWSENASGVNQPQGPSYPCCFSPKKTTNVERLFHSDAALPLSPLACGVLFDLHRRIANTERERVRANVKAVPRIH